MKRVEHSWKAATTHRLYRKLLRKPERSNSMPIQSIPSGHRFRRPEQTANIGIKHMPPPVQQCHIRLRFMPPKPSPQDPRLALRSDRRGDNFARHTINLEIAHSKPMKVREDCAGNEAGNH
jgi:hypothetical protein